ncbi:MAG: flagellin [Candidatus Sulfotelmatobacter sp.]
MPLGILNNIPSLAAENELTLTSNALNSTLEQLSSGSRINSGADDPAGLAIANGLQANIAALSQSVSNANDGVGELQLADGALAQVTTLLDTAVTLATESATGTVSNAQRTAIQAQYSSILDEINRIGTATTYNSQAVFQSGTQPNLNEQNSPAAAGTLNLNDVLTQGDTTTVSAGGQTFTYTAATTSGTNPNGVVGSATGIDANTALTAADVITLTRGTGTTTYTVGANGSTVGELITAIDTGANTANITVAGTDASHTGYQATVQNGSIQFQDLTNQGDLAATEGDTTLGATFANPTTASSTVQDLINAINSDTTVGAKAALVSGTLEITDPQNRGDLAVSTNDTVLGATVQGAPTNFVTPNTTGVPTPDLNELVSSAAGLTDATAIANGTTTLTAGGKTFTYTAAGGTGTVGALINAINNPTTDPALLTAYLNSAGNLVVTDPNNNNNVASGATVAAALGTLSNPLQIGAAETNIFLSDATSIGSSQIGVVIGGLSTASITNGSGGSTVNLANTDLSTQSDAQSALTLIDQAIANVASTRGTLGASVNRLTAASNVINSQVQNLTSAENTITAADIPTAVANLTKYSILEQTGISALAQANQQQQLVLKLLQ